MNVRLTSQAVCPIFACTNHLKKIDMKTLKPLLISLALIFSILSISATAGERCKQPAKAYSMDLVKAMHDQALVVTMHQQLDPGFLNTFQLVYTKKIVYKNLVIQISGTRVQWQMFFWPCGTRTMKFKKDRVND
jgi:hypothetical protein